MSLIDVLGPERRDGLRRLAARVEADDDTAVIAWTAWQHLASMSPTDRTKALSLVIALEEIKRASEGRPAMFKVEKRPNVRAVRR